MSDYDFDGLGLDPYFLSNDFVVDDYDPIDYYPVCFFWMLMIMIWMIIIYCLFDIQNIDYQYFICYDFSRTCLDCGLIFLPPIWDKRFARLGEAKNLFSYQFI